MDALQIPEMIVTGMADLGYMIVKSVFVFESNVTLRFFSSTTGKIELWMNDTGKFWYKILSLVSVLMNLVLSGLRFNFTPFVHSRTARKSLSQLNDDGIKLFEFSC